MISVLSLPFAATFFPHKHTDKKLLYFAWAKSGGGGGGQWAKRRYVNVHTGLPDVCLLVDGSSVLIMFCATH